MDIVGSIGVFGVALTLFSVIWGIWRDKSKKRKRRIREETEQGQVEATKTSYELERSAESTKWLLEIEAERRPDSTWDVWLVISHDWKEGWIPEVRVEIDLQAILKIGNVSVARLDQIRRRLPFEPGETVARIHSEPMSDYLTRAERTVLRARSRELKKVESLPRVIPSDKFRSKPASSPKDRFESIANHNSGDGEIYCAEQSYEWEIYGGRGKRRTYPIYSPFVALTAFDFKRGLAE